jgi:hypothetical protein
MATKITGNLYRGNDGKFQAGGADTTPSVLAAPPTKRSAASVRRQTRRQARQQRQDIARQAREATRQDEQAARDQEDAAVDAIAKPADRAKKRREIAAARRERAKKRREAEREQQAQERETRQREDADESAAQAQDTQRKPDKKEKPKKGGGGKGKPEPEKKPSSEERATQKKADNRQAVQQQMAQTDMGLSPSGFTAFMSFADGGALELPMQQQLSAMGLVEGDPPRLSSAGRGAIAAMDRGDYRDAVDAIGRGQQRMQAAVQRQADQQARQADVEQKRAEAAAQRATRAAETAQRRVAVEQRRITRDRERQQRQALADQRRADIQAAQLARLNRGVRVVGKSFVVLKDAHDQLRWISRTTTAYQDRDGEILSTEALERDSQRMIATKQYGPLRWWHVGTPNPLDTTAPWGPGLDLGMCDYNILIGRTLVESGTFKNATIARQVAAIADRLEMSPGFFHAIDQPRNHVFTDIRCFERSLVPLRYGRASNLFTGLTTKEHHMDMDEMERRFKAAITELGLSPAQASDLGAQLVATEKAAQGQGIAFKSSTAPEEITLNGQTYTLKAAPPPVDVVDEEVMAADLTPGEPEGDEVSAESDGEFVGDMTPDAFFARMAEVLAPVLKVQDMHKSISDMVGELKSLTGGVATKDASHAEELVALKAQQTDLTKRIVIIEGNQPATFLPEELAHALKSTGPQVLEGSKPGPVVPTDPSRPLAALGAATFPLLYSEDGWQLPAS